MPLNSKMKIRCLPSRVPHSEEEQIKTWLRNPACQKFRVILAHKVAAAKFRASEELMTTELDSAHDPEVMIKLARDEIRAAGDFQRLTDLLDEAMTSEEFYTTIELNDHA